MTDKQQRFADEYLIDCNATRAYKVAYPHTKSDNVAKSAGNRLLTFVDVKKYIEEQLQKLSDAKIATASEVMEFMSGVMRGSVKEIDQEVVDGEMITVESEPRIREKLKAAELLAKRFGLDKSAENNAEISQTIKESIDKLTDALSNPTQNRNIEDFEHE